MNERHEIKIEVNALNPVEYLACCGIFEITSRFDETALAHWQINKAMFFILESNLSESHLLKTIVFAITNLKAWIFTPEKGGLYQTTLKFRLEDPVTKITLDWWYERLNQDVYESKKNEVSAKEWSAWKMYAGTIFTRKVFENLILACQRILEIKTSQSFTDLIGCCLLMEKGVKGRTYFDPRCSRNQLDVGFSADKVKPSDDDSKTETYPFCEILAMFGVQGFFPPRTNSQCNKESTRSWDDRPSFKYQLWKHQLPIMLARISATGFETTLNEDVSVFNSQRVKRGDYSNLTFSVMELLQRRAK